MQHQETRINQQMDSQVKRLLQRSIDHETIKKAFLMAMDFLQVYIEQEEDINVETCEDLLELKKVYNQHCAPNLKMSGLKEIEILERFNDATYTKRVKITRPC